jgi:hypothetical protein
MGEKAGIIPFVPAPALFVIGVSPTKPLKCAFSAIPHQDFRVSQP